MGLYLQTALIKRNTITEIEKCISVTAQEYPHMNLDWKDCQYHIYKDRIGVLFSEDTTGYAELTEVLSKKLETEVLMLYISDGDYWGYYFYENGQELDAFSPMPDDFTEDESEAEHFKGNGEILAERFSVKAQKLAPYLMRWTDEVLQEDERKACKGDEYPYGDCWQMADFMDALGYPYAYSVEEKEEVPLFPTLNEILLQKLPPQEIDGMETDLANIPYKLANLPHSLDYDYVYDVLQSNVQEDLKGIGEMCILDAQALLQQKENANKGKCSKELYIVLAFTWHWREFSMMRYWNIYSAIDRAPNDVMLLRTRGLVAGIHSKPHIGMKDNTKLLELDAANREVYLLGRAFYAFMNGKKEKAMADMKELFANKFDYENDPRICWENYTNEFKQFVEEMKKEVL